MLRVVTKMNALNIYINKTNTNWANNDATESRVYQLEHTEKTLIKK